MTFAIKGRGGSNNKWQMSWIKKTFLTLTYHYRLFSLGIMNNEIDDESDNNNNNDQNDYNYDEGPDYANS